MTHTACLFLWQTAILQAGLSTAPSETAGLGMAKTPLAAPPVLTSIDYALTALAVAGLVFMAIRWLSGSGRDPLHEAPRRLNRLREQTLAWVVVGYLSGGLALAGLANLVTGEPESIRARMVVGNGAHLIGIGICLIIATSCFRGGLRRFWIAERAPRIGVGCRVTVFLTVLVLGLCPWIARATMALTLLFVPDYEFAQHPTIKALHDDTQTLGLVVSFWVGATLIAPIAEEFFFRGLLQTLLVRWLSVWRRRRSIRQGRPRVYSRWMAIVLASLAFGAVHIGQPHAIAALAVLGGCLGYAYERTGSLLPPIAIHAVFNLKTLIWDALSG